MTKQRKISWIIYIVLLNLHNLLFLPASVTGYSPEGYTLSVPIDRITMFSYYYTNEGSWGTYELYDSRIWVFTVTLTLTFIAIDYILKQKEQ